MYASRSLFRQTGPKNAETIHFMFGGRFGVSQKVQNSGFFH
jgi:hypothetical protein